MTASDGDHRQEDRGQRKTWLIAAGFAIVVAILIGWLVLRTPGEGSVAGQSQSPATSIPTPSQVTQTSSSTESKDSGSNTKGSETTPGTTLKEVPPVGLDSESERPDGVVIALRKVESVAGEAKLPGEVAGPALRLTISIRNGTAADLSLDSVVVNGYRGAKRVPLEMLSSPGGAPFSGTVKPGDQSTGVYIFTVTPEQRADVTFTVDVTPGQPAAVFRGDGR